MYSTSTYTLSIFKLFKSISSKRAVSSKKPLGVLKLVERLAEELKL